MTIFGITWLELIQWYAVGMVGWSVFVGLMGDPYDFGALIGILTWPLTLGRNLGVIINRVFR